MSGVTRLDIYDPSEYTQHSTSYHIEMRAEMLGAWIKGWMLNAEVVAYNDKAAWLASCKWFEY